MTPKLEPDFPSTFCMCCGRTADLQDSDEGYSRCCNDRISDDPFEHPNHPDNRCDEED